MRQAPQHAPPIANAALLAVQTIRGHAPSVVGAETPSKPLVEVRFLSGAPKSAEIAADAALSRWLEVHRRGDARVITEMGGPAVQGGA